MKDKNKYQKIVVVGTSAGGINAVKEIISKLPANFPAPIVVVQHMNSFMSMFFLEYLNSFTHLKVKEVTHMELLLPGRIYYIPPNYHALLENGRIILNSDAKVNYSRPSIDVFFESVAFEEKEKAIGILLTGANNDGSYGMQLIQNGGGTTLIQNPTTAEHSEMPKAAIAMNHPDFTLDLEDIVLQLVRLVYSVGK